MPSITRKSPRLPITKPSPRKGRIVRASAASDLIVILAEDDILASLMAPPTAMAFCEAENGLHICTRVVHIDDTHIAHYSDGTIALAWKLVKP